MEVDISVPPKAKQIIKELSIHNHKRIDNYFWLNQRENSEVIDYLNKENVYLEEKLGHTKKFRNKLFDEITGRIKQTDESVPYRDNGYYYYSRYEEGNEYPIYCRKKDSLETVEEIMLDVNHMAKGYDYYHVKGLNVSENNKLLAFGVDTVSRRIYTLHIKNLETGEILTDKIENTTGSSVWANDNKTLFFSTKDETLRPDKIMRHSLGSKVDKLVYHENDKTYSLYFWKSKSNNYIFIFANSTLSTEMLFLNANQPEGSFQVLQNRERDHEYHAVHFNNIFYILTNWKAKNFRLMKTAIDKPGKDNWQEVIAHQDDVLLSDIEIFKNFMALSERKNGLTLIQIIEHKSGDKHYIDFGEPAYDA